MRRFRLPFWGRSIRLSVPSSKEVLYFRECVHEFFNGCDLPHGQYQSVPKGFLRHCGEEMYRITASSARLAEPKAEHIKGGVRFVVDEREEEFVLGRR
jgi:hypothetical protein